MLKSILLAGVLLVTSNFMPSSSVSVPTVIAAEQPAAVRPHALPLVATKDALEDARPTVSLASLRWPAPEGDVSEALAPEEREFIARINTERTARGLNALTLDPLLVVTARGHSREMCDRDYFDHHSPTPGIETPMDRYLTSLHESGSPTPRYVLVGENIYYCSETTDTYNVEFGHRALMNSPGHRANILEPRFGKVGVGVYRNARGEFWVTEMFLSVSP